MVRDAPVDLDVVIFGGGAAGLWLLAALARRRTRVLLLEAHHLGSGQTVASQGIIHGGLKYTLSGLLTPAARSIRAMPTIWRRCLAGEQAPDLSAVRRRAEFCHLWHTRSLRSRAGMIGARAGLRVAPTVLAREARPAVLGACPGVVARLEEQVVDPRSLLTVLAEQQGTSILRIDTEGGLELTRDGAGDVRLVRLLNPQSGDPLDLRPRAVVLTAGAGNDRLRHAAGLARDRGQRRPLHMVLARGSLPVLNGHCVDGSRTRATITTTRDYADRTVWQIGGQIAEDGTRLEPGALVEHAVREITAILPRLDLSGVEWATYRVDRAEGATSGGRPADERIVEEGNVLTAWPTKLALVPRLVERLVEILPSPPGDRAPVRAGAAETIAAWPRPSTAIPPWEKDIPWIIVS